ncbi:MAG: hypothetical protein KGN77_14295 [Xanthomonadaceae bacterium]|nr:hypothetical protein [Xanthomonadaceae bacterium]MDE1963202.1 hypothetical protein [Xanthomonadaceae bacterium]
MQRSAMLPALLSLILAAPLAACSQSDHAASGTRDAVNDAPSAASSSFIAEQVKRGIDQAKRELATRDINLNDVHVTHGHHGDDAQTHDSRPQAAITPQGDLVIAGKTVPATPEQHAMLVDYRQQVIRVAEAGMDIGASGAALGTHAAREAIFGALSGKSGDEIEAHIKPQAEKIKADALKLCARLPDMLATQQKLAAAMPEFRPYATMTQKDVDDCGKDVENDND